MNHTARFLRDVGGWCLLVSFAWSASSQAQKRCPLSIVFENHTKGTSAQTVALSVDFGRSRVEHPLIRSQPMAEKKQVWSRVLSSGEREERVESLRFNGTCDISRRFQFRVCRRATQQKAPRCVSLRPRTDQPFLAGPWHLRVTYGGTDSPPDEPKLNALLMTDASARIIQSEPGPCPIRLQFTDLSAEASRLIVWDIGASRVEDPTWSWHGLVSKTRKDPWWVRTGVLSPSAPLTMTHSFEPKGSGLCTTHRRFRLRICDVQPTSSASIHCETLEVPHGHHASSRYVPGPWTFSFDRLPIDAPMRFRQSDRVQRP